MEFKWCFTFFIHTLSPTVEVATCPPCTILSTMLEISKNPAPALVAVQSFDDRPLQSGSQEQPHPAAPVGLSQPATVRTSEVIVASWAKVELTTEDGGCGGQALIVSANRSTDIPAFYAGWFISVLRRLRKWFNPFSECHSRLVCRTRWSFSGRKPPPMLEDAAQEPLDIVEQLGRITTSSRWAITRPRIEPNVPPRNPHWRVRRACQELAIPARQRPCDLAVRPLLLTDAGAGCRSSGLRYRRQDRTAHSASSSVLSIFKPMPSRTEPKEQELASGGSRYSRWRRSHSL